MDFANAYLIFDINGHVIEHCGTTNSPYFDLNTTAYYGGALIYSVRDEDSFINLNTNEVLTDEECAYLTASFDEVMVDEDICDSSISYTYSSGYDVQTDYITGPFEDYPQSLHDMLVDCFFDENGTDYTSLPSGMN